MLADQLPAFKQGHTHGNPCLFCLIRSRNNTAIIVAEHNNRLAVQMRFEQTLTGAVEAVAIDNGEHAYT